MRVKPRTLAAAALLLAATFLGPTVGAQSGGTPPPAPLVPGPAPIPAIPGWVPPGVPALPKRLDATGGAQGLQITIGPVEKALDPIGVPDALCEGSKEACALVTEVLRNDLRLSGYFNVLPPKTYLADMAKETLTTTSWPDWNNVGATYLVKAQVRGGGSEVDFRLYNVVEKRAYTLDKQHRTGLSKDKLRRATHDFVNEVLALLSGTPGDFGTPIVYAYKTGLQTKGIGITDMDGYGDHGVFGGSSIHMLPSWAPGGGVVYTSYKSGKPDVWIGKQRLTKDGNHYRKARFSPDGGTVAVAVGMEDQTDIWLMSPDGTLIKNLTNNWADDVSPTWSPDGSQIAFVSNRSGGPQIYVMSRDGGGQRRLSMAGTYNSTPDWGKDGLIAFAGLDMGHSDIFTVDLEGNISRLTQDQGNNRDPTWSPNGRYLAFTSDREGGNQLWIMTADGRWQFRIGDRGGVSTPTWQK